MLQVVDSKCRSDINIKGIVVRESTRSFHLITQKDDKVRIIPKAGHVFRSEVEGEGGQVVTVTLYGSGLVDRMKALEVMAGTMKKDKKHRNEGQRAHAEGPGRIVTPFHLHVLRWSSGLLSAIQVVGPPPPCRQYKGVLAQVLIHGGGPTLLGAQDEVAGTWTAPPLTGKVHRPTGLTQQLTRLHG